MSLKNLEKELYDAKSDGILRICKDYIKSYFSPQYIGVGAIAGAYGAACAAAGYAIPEIFKLSFEGMQYFVQNFPYIDFHKCFDYAINSFSTVSSQSIKEGLKGFAQFFVGSIFVVKLFWNRISKIFEKRR
jgi:hypothetical protein